MLCMLPFGWRNTVRTFAIRTEKTWQNHKDSNTLRIITWNMEYFYDLKPKALIREGMLKTIEEFRPDIICIQEYLNIENHPRLVSPKKELDSLGYKFNFCSNDLINKKRNRLREEGVAIFSKMPFTDSFRIGLTKAPKSETLIYTDILFKNKPLRIFTAHLSSFALYTDTAWSTDGGDNIYVQTYDRKHAIQYKLRETEILHQKEVSIIRKSIAASPHPVIYCGDLNTTPASYNYSILRDDLQDAFLEKGSGIGATFYKILPTLRIDVCFVDNLLQVQQCKAEERKLSDHYPVITDVKWKQ